MPYVNKKTQSEYQRQWRQKRRLYWIGKNGPCKVCGGSEDLEVDHVNPCDKSMNPSQIWSMCEGKRTEELSKCQVLCKKCHRKKTLNEMKKTKHGKLWMYQKYGCRCSLCRDAKRLSDLKYRSKSGKMAESG